MSFWAGVVVGVISLFVVSTAAAFGLGAYLSRRAARESLFDYRTLIGDEITVEGEYDDTATTVTFTKDYSEYFSQS
jgi:hypothetical protein